MNDLAPDHPAIPDEALLAALNAETCRKRTRLAAYAPDHIAEMRRTLTAALPHLTADDLRDTPAGQALIAEGRGWMPATERDRRALEILNDHTVPAATRHLLEKGMRLLHKLQKETGR